MKKLKYIKPEAEVVHFHLMDGDLYTLSGGQNGNLADGSAFAAVCFLCLRQKCESSCA